MLKLEHTPEDFFWQEKMFRYIENCESLQEVKEVATLLVKIATTRQVAIKGLVKDNLEILTKGLQSAFTEGDDNPVDKDWETKLKRPNPFPSE